MLLFKTSGKTWDSVIKHQKHAFNGKPKDVEKGEIILVSKNKNDLLPHEKQIQYIMRLKEFRLAEQEEIDKYWPGNKGRWKYIVDCYDTKALPNPFNLKEILDNPKKDYSKIMTFAKIDPSDESIIMEVLKQQEVI